MSISSHSPLNWHLLTRTLTNRIQCVPEIEKKRLNAKYKYIIQDAQTATRKQMQLITNNPTMVINNDTHNN